MFLSVKPKKKQFIYDIRESDEEGPGDEKFKRQRVSLSYNAHFYNFPRIRNFDFKEIGAKCIKLK